MARPSLSVYYTDQPTAAQRRPTDIMVRRLPALAPPPAAPHAAAARRARSARAVPRACAAGAAGESVRPLTVFVKKCA